jgi:hypothetical protein
MTIVSFLVQGFVICGFVVVLMNVVDDWALFDFFIDSFFLIKIDRLD